MIAFRRAYLPVPFAFTMLLASCSILETRPGHPESWKNDYCYDHWPKNQGDDLLADDGAKTHCKTGEFPSGNHDQKFGSPAGASTTMPGKASDGSNPQSAPPQPAPPNGQSYLSDKVPAQIWTARGYVHLLERRYEAAEHHAQDVADYLAVPILGAAAAAVGAAIFDGATAISAAGLGGGTFGAANTYMHPEQDAASDRTAAQGLLCVLDETSTVKNRDVDVLVTDELALRYALMDLEKAAGPLLTEPQTDRKSQAAQDAVKDIQGAGLQTRAAIDDEIDNYNNLVPVIYKTADKIDFKARNAGTRSISYDDVRHSITEAAKQSAISQNMAKAAEDQTQKAAAVAGTVLDTRETKKLLSDEPLQDAGISAFLQETPPSTESPDDNLALPQIKPRKDILTAPTNVMVKVVQLSQIALADLPKTSFADIAGNVAACAVNGN